MSSIIWQRIKYTAHRAAVTPQLPSPFFWGGLGRGAQNENENENEKEYDFMRFYHTHYHSQSRSLIITP